MAPDFANYGPDDEEDPYEDLEYGDSNPVEAAEFDAFLFAIDNVDLIRLPAFNKFEALLSDKVIEAVVKMFQSHDLDKSLPQAIESEHPALAAIDECFTSTEPGDVREVFMAVRAIIDRTIDEQYDAEDGSDAETATTKMIYDQLLRSGCESLVSTIFDSIFQSYQERLQNIFIDPFSKVIQLQQKRLELLSSDTDLDEAGREDHALALYQESVEQAQKISQEEFANEYLKMDEEYPKFVEIAVGELYDLAPDLMQIPAIDNTDGVDYLSSLESEWRERYAGTFSEKLDEIFANAREQIYLALKDLYDSLPQSVKEGNEGN